MNKIHGKIVFIMSNSIQRSANSNQPLKRIALTRKLVPYDLDLGKDYTNTLRRMLEHALLAARSAERQVVKQKAEIDRLRTLSITDENTGLLNRRGFSEALARALARGHRYGEPAVLLLIDLDEFKAMNDTFGHAAGDIVLGVVAGMREASLRDRSISVASIIATSVPEFASGVFLASVFAVWLGWLPGTSPLSLGGDWSLAQQLVLPVAVMVLYDLGYVVRMVRASMVEVMRAPYIRTAVLKGLTRSEVIFRHALRNALIAPFTVILLQINYLITGVVVVEAVFAYPGFGRMMLDAALAQDIALIEAGALVAVVIAIGTQIAGDIGYMLLNPRIRVR